MRSPRPSSFPCLPLLLFVALFSVQVACASEIEPDVAPGDPPPIDHGVWGELLAKYVRTHESGVNRFAYGEFIEADRARLDSYLVDLESVPISRYEDDQRMVFWINLYNALTVRVILDHYPLDSITQIDLTPPADGPWDAKLATVDERQLSLNDIEQGILRPEFLDPRIHYAVNCASYGCPNLFDEPFTVENLEDLLEQGAEDFINHPRGARFEGDELVVSSIFQWYQEDFGGSEQGVIDHLLQYAEGELAERLESYGRGYRHDYDWSLNVP